VSGVPDTDRPWQGLKGGDAFRSLAEGVPAILYIDAPDALSTNLYTSPQVEEILGYSPEEWIAKPSMWIELLHPQDRQRVAREHEQTNRTGDPFNIEYRLIARDGRVVWFRDEAFMVRDAAGRPLFWRGVMLDISGQKETEDKLRRSLEILNRTMDQRRALMARLERAQEEERRRIAADIHDDPIQVMSAADIRIQGLAQATTDPQARRELGEVHETVLQAIERLRHLLFELRPPSLDDKGLVAALGLYVDHVARESGFQASVKDGLDGEPPDESASILFRIAQEALANVRKHAGATRVEVALEERDGGIALRITDDGKGFDLESVRRPMPGHLGMSAMPERAELAGGWCRVDSSPGGGTTVECWLPAASPGPAAVVERPALRPHGHR
jgi:PAS domain S-box-containing protein